MTKTTDEITVIVDGVTLTLAETDTAYLIKRGPTTVVAEFDIDWETFAAFCGRWVSRWVEGV